MQTSSTPFSFSTKAGTLAKLKDHLILAQIPEFITCTVADWRNNPETILRQVQEQFKNVRVIVRSSALSEDNQKVAMAGAYTSVPDVDPSNKDCLTAAIGKVIASYKEVDGFEESKNELLIQTMISDVSMSGVLFTQDMKLIWDKGHCVPLKKLPPGVSDMIFPYLLLEDFQLYFSTL